MAKENSNQSAANQAVAQHFTTGGRVSISLSLSEVSHVEKYLNVHTFKPHTKGFRSGIISCLGSEDRIIFCVQSTLLADKAR